MLNIINSKKYAIGVLLDMTKAYDKVQFNILLKKLYDIGIRGKSYEWFKSFLYDREHFVSVEYFNPNTKEIMHVRSSGKTINASIPQGSVISCLLFLIYINDLPKIVHDHCILFADDISLLIPYNNDLNLNNKLHSIFNLINKWMTDHNLEINFQKTKIIPFYPHQKSPLNIDFTYENNRIETVNDVTLLGLIIDTHLNWKSHIQKLKSKLSSFAYALREVKITTDIQTSLTIYYAYAYAWFSYGVIMWGNSTDAPSLFILQKKLIRIIFNLHNTDSCKPYFVEHKILTLPCIYIYWKCANLFENIQNSIKGVGTAPRVTIFATVTN